MAILESERSCLVGGASSLTFLKAEKDSGVFGPGMVRMVRTVPRTMPIGTVHGMVREPCGMVPNHAMSDSGWDAR